MTSGAGANNRHRSAGELGEIGGDIESVFASAMRTADAAGGNDVYARSGSDEDSGGDRCCSRPAGGEDRGKIGAAGLGHIGGFGNGRDLLFGKTHDELPVEEGKGCREGAASRTAAPSGEPWRNCAAEVDRGRLPSIPKQPPAGRRLARRRCRSGRK